MNNLKKPPRISHSSMVSLGFLIFSVAWIGITDFLTAALFPRYFPDISLWKGWLFIAIATFLLKVVLGAEERRHAELEARLHQDAIHDPLTNLLNRRAFVSHLEAAVERVRRTGARLGLAFIDLDRFKEANDKYGHAFGDKLLQVVAQRLRGTLRSADIAGRMGGDEFVIVVEPDKADSAETLARRLLDAFRLPLDIDGQTFSVTLSVGVAHFPDNGTEAEQLVRAADFAMYAAKAAGRNGFALAPQKSIQENDRPDVIFEPSLDSTGG